MTVPSVDDRTYGFRGTIQFDFLPDRIFRTEKFLINVPSRVNESVLSLHKPSSLLILNAVSGR